MAAKRSPKPNRAHYRVHATGRLLCVFHARRARGVGFSRLDALHVERGMSRPDKAPCDECLVDARRCEHDWQDKPCPRIQKDGCGRDVGRTGGSW